MQLSSDNQGTKAGQRRGISGIQELASTAVTINTVLHVRSEQASLLLFGISSVGLSVDTKWILVLSLKRFLS